MHVNFNRLVNILLILLSLIAAGCSETSKTPLSISDQLPGSSSDEDYSEHYPHARSRLNFGKQKFKSASSQHNTVWDRLLSLYSLPEFDNARIDRAIDWYLQHPASLAIIQQRAEPYLHHILDEVEAKNIPGELALLPVVESAFVADAYSTADASGLWQFVPATGEEYGLQQNDWYDGRRDVYASTKAATTYLKELSETFDGDWLLALASYNCGKGRVRKSIERNEYRNLPTDYWSLDLPEETLGYVPKLLAVAKIFANAEEYNIHLQHIPNKPYFEVVHIKAPLDLHKAARLANTPYDKFVKLNPGFNRACTAPEGPHRLLIPVAQAQSFKRNLAQLPYDEWADYTQYYRTNKVAQNRRKEEKPVQVDQEEAPTTVISQYKVRPGETLSTIASRTHTTISSLRSANHLASNKVLSGVSLKIPTGNKAKLFADEKKSIISANLISSKASKNKAANNQVYAIKKGDTFWNISQRFSVNPKDIAQWNNITLKTALVPGRKLVIKSSNQQLASASPSIRLIHYTVNKGDTLTKISKKFNVSIDDLRKSNSDMLIRNIRPGQKLKVIVDAHSAT
ncbi:MAG: LysM peptidoglycan-binding domain-containing protein [Methylovulum sp.]|nr:LysM peptidoglycan-binding domain-containing protein [Methylovulum sp.]